MCILRKAVYVPGGIAYYRTAPVAYLPRIQIAKGKAEGKGTELICSEAAYLYRRRTPFRCGGSAESSRLNTLSDVQSLKVFTYQPFPYALLCEMNKTNLRNLMNSMRVSSLLHLAVAVVAVAHSSSYSTRPMRLNMSPSLATGLSTKHVHRLRPPFL